MVRLGAGGLDGRSLTPEAMHAALQVLSKFRRLAESHRIEQLIAVATSAVREAENGGEFLQAITDETGIRAACHFRDRGGAPHPPCRGVRGRRAGRCRGGHRHRRRQRRGDQGVGAGRRVGTKFQAGCDPPDGTVRQDRPARAARRAQTGAPCRRGNRQVSGPGRARRIRSRGRHVGDDHEHRRRRVRGGGTAARYAASQSPAVRETDPAGPEDARGARPRRSDACAGSGAAPRRSRRGRRHPARRIAATARRRRDHALRPVIARGRGAGLHRPAPERDRAGGAIPGCAATQRLRAGGAVPLLAGALAPGRAARDGLVRRNARDSRPHRSRARLAGVRGDPARYRRPDQLRAAPQALLLPDQER